MMPDWFRRMPLPTPVKHLAGSAWLMAGRLFAMGSIAGFGLAVFVGALSAIDSIFDSRDNWYEEGRLADLELRVVTDDMENFPDFRNLPGVTDVRIRMVYPGSMTLPGQGVDHLRAIVISTGRDSKTPINVQTLIEGSSLDPADRDGVVIERSLARYHGVKVGEQLQVKLGKDEMTLHVRGIAADAEFLLAPANPSLFVPSKGSLGVVYVNPALLSERFGFQPANSVLFRVSEGAGIETVRQAVIERAQLRLNVDSTTTQTEQFSHQFLEKDLRVFRIVVPVIVTVSALSAVFVTAFLFMQWVARETQALAMFLTLGHSPQRLVVSFIVVFAYLAVGVVCGGLLCAMFVGQGFLQSFSEAIGLPMPVFRFSPTYVGWGIAGVIGIFSAAGTVALRRILRLSPREAMRNNRALERTPDRLGTAVAGLMPRSWLRLPIRSLFRHRLVSGLCVIAVGLGFGITAAFFIAFSSFVGTSVNRVEQNTWDAAVDFMAPMWQENVDELAKTYGIAEFTPYTKGVVQAVQGQRRINLYVGGFDPSQSWHAVALTDGEGLSAAVPDGALLERNVAAELGVSVGSRLTVEVQGRRRDVLVRGLFSGALPGEARFTLAFHQELADLSERSTGLFIRSNKNLDALAKALRGDDDVQQVLTKSQVSGEIVAASGQVTEIIRLGAFISIAIAALLVFACVGYTVLQRQAEYQMLRLLGYQDGFITLIVVVEIALLGLASLLLAVPVGALAADYINQKLSLAWFQVDTIISTADYLKTFVPGFLLLPLVALPLARTVLKVPLSVSLRSREIA